MYQSGKCTKVAMYQCGNVPMYQVNRASERILREMEGRDGVSHASERLLQARGGGSRRVMCCFPPRPPAQW